MHAAKIRRKEAGWAYSLVLYVGMLGTIIVGLWNNGKGKYRWRVDLVRLGLLLYARAAAGTMFAILAFFIASAAYRSFRTSREAAVLLVAAVIVMMGRVPLGEYILPLSGDLSSWILNVLNASVRRAILIGVSLVLSPLVQKSSSAWNAPTSAGGKGMTFAERMLRIDRRIIFW